MITPLTAKETNQIVIAEIAAYRAIGKSITENSNARKSTSEIWKAGVGSLIMQQQFHLGQISMLYKMFPDLSAWNTEKWSQ